MYYVYLIIYVYYIIRLRLAGILTAVFMLCNKHIVKMNVYNNLINVCKLLLELMYFNIFYNVGF